MIVLYHERSLAPAMVHHVHLMPSIQMNQLLLHELFCLSTHVAPLDVYATTVFPSYVCVALVLFRVAPSTHATPPILIPFSSYPSTFT